jgi:hypothetical protein
MPDSSRGQLEAYVLATDGTPGEINLKYWDVVNNTMTSALISDGYVGASLAVGLLDEVNRRLYVSAPTDGVYKIELNPADPTQLAGRPLTRYGNEVDTFAMVLDNEQNLLFAGRGAVIWLLRPGQSPMAMNHPRLLNYDVIFGLHHLAGENGVGDQIFVQSERTNPIYVNYNDSYDDFNDDTYITLNVNNNWRPSKITFGIADYNHLLVSIGNQGLYKVTLNRGWVESGQVVGVPTRPDNSLVVDNYLATVVEGQPIAVGGLAPEPAWKQWLKKLIKPVFAADNAIQYFVSNDDGQTWTEIELGSLLQLDRSDYRIKYKIVMTAQGEESPVLDLYQPKRF